MTSGHPPSPPRPGRPAPAADVLRGAGAWLLRLCLAAAAVIAAWQIGGPLALYGLGGVAALAATALLVLGATGWRRAALPLSLVAAALCAGAAQVAATPVRLDRSTGLLLAQPETLTQAGARDYRRGTGDMIVDLRRTRFDQDRATLRVRADTGRIVVALPHDRCVGLDVRVTSSLPTDGSSPLDSGPLMALRAVRPLQTYGTALDPGAWQRPGFAEQAGPILGGSLLWSYGRPQPPADGSDVHWTRSAPNAPMLRLELVTPAAAVVRDYPESAAPASGLDGQIGPQIADVSWPSSVVTPRTPADMRLLDALPDDVSAWRRSLERDPQLARRWAAWFDRWKISAAKVARLAAGPCATPDLLSTTWSSTYLAPPPDGAFGSRGPANSIAFAANGRGEIRRTQIDAETGAVTTTPIRSNPFQPRSEGSR